MKPEMQNNILLKSALALVIVDLVLIVAILLQVNGLVKDVVEVQNRQLEVEGMKERLEKSKEIEKVETKVEKIDLDTSKWLTYRNEEHNFEIKYPKELETMEGRAFDYAFHVFFSLNNSVRFGILPKGELDYGLPFTEPKVQNLIIAEREVVKKEWLLDNGNVLIHIYFKNYPKSWNKNNRLDITGPRNSIELVNKMVENFKFID